MAARVDGPRKRCADVRHLSIEARLELRAITGTHPGRGFAGEGQAPASEPLAHHVRAGVGVELLERVLADRLEHGQPPRASDDELFRHERVQLIDRCFGHLLGHRELDAAREQRHATERASLGIAEQLVAPVDRGSQGSLAGRRVSRAAREESQRVVESLGKLVRLEHPHARSGELKCEWKAVEASAHVVDMGRAAAVQAEVRVVRHGTIQEQRDGRVALVPG